MSQKQSILFGDTIDDINLNRLAAIPAGVYEGMVPALIGTGGTNGWTLRLSASERGISVWKTTGDATHGRLAVEETSNIELAIDPADTLPRIDLAIGYHRWVEGPIDPDTGRPTGEFTTLQHARYCILKGTPAAVPEPPPVPLPFNVDGDTACILAVVRVADATMNSAYCERWDPTDWTAERRGIPHVVHFRATNPSPGSDSLLAFRTVNATSVLWQYDWEDEAIIVPRSGWVQVHLRANLPTEEFSLTRKPFGGIVFDAEASSVGHFAQTIYLHGGDRVQIHGTTTDEVQGQMTYLGFSEQDTELQDADHVFPIANVDTDVYGTDTFPRQISIPILYSGATDPVEWDLLPGTDLPGATLNGNNIEATLTEYGAWTIKLFGRDANGYIGRKSWHYWKFAGPLTITNATYNLFGSASGRTWGDVSGAGYGETGKVGSTESFQITKTGGLGPYKYYARAGNNLLNPTCPEATGACVLWTRSHAPTDANRALGLPEYCGESLVELKVQDWTGYLATKTCYFYSPRIHAGYGMADRSWRRDAANAVTVQRKPSGNTINLYVETGQPTQSAFRTGSHAWEITSSTLPSATLTPSTGPATTVQAPFPLTNGTYSVTLGAQVTANGASVWAREAISVTVAPYGTLGVGWALYDDTIPTGARGYDTDVYMGISNDAGTILLTGTAEDVNAAGALLHVIQYNPTTNQWDEVTSAIPNFLSDNTHNDNGAQDFDLLENVEKTKIGLFVWREPASQFVIYDGSTWVVHATDPYVWGGKNPYSYRWKGTTILAVVDETGYTGRSLLYKAEGEGTPVSTGVYLPDPTGGYEHMIWNGANTADRWLLWGSSQGYTGTPNGWLTVSADEGLTWSSPVPISNYVTELSNIIAIGSKFFMYGKNGSTKKQYVSSDGINWTETVIPFKNDYDDIESWNENGEGSVMLLCAKREGFFYTFGYILTVDGGTSWIQGPDHLTFMSEGPTGMMPLHNGVEWMWGVGLSVFAHSPAQLWYYRTT